ncbi:secreted RxLR effector protein 161-like [Trifolium pratense]|uniref:secreted RxLR effector protein 161-like n=1 Tax=Trifolium pratense TaxID=57577 RepID=UPI001E6971B7|nr:secreted RxLR effector protein 161-like [Trifolium pratense]
METIRLVTALAHYNKWSTHQMDVKCAFLNGPLEEEVYVVQPPGFIDKENESKKTNEGLILHQRKYANEILKRFKMDKCNPALTPSEPRLQLTKETDERDVDAIEYRRLIGSLRYLCNTRPDIPYNVGIVSRYMERPKISHLSATKRILRYIKGTLDSGIVFQTSDGSNFDLVGYTDSDWCGDKDDRKSTAGYIFLYGGAPISLCSRKEPVVALSTCEAEYIVASLSACQSVWLSNLITEISPYRSG